MRQQLQVLATCNG